MSRSDSRFAFHVRLYDETAVDLTRPDLLSDNNLMRYTDARSI